jgi:hypothetical protein
LQVETTAANKLVLNLDKTHVIKFVTNNSPKHILSDIMKNVCMRDLKCNCSGLQIDNLKLKTAHIIPKLRAACYAI